MRCVAIARATVVGFKIAGGTSPHPVTVKAALWAIWSLHLDHGEETHFKLAQIADRMGTAPASAYRAVQCLCRDRIITAIRPTHQRRHVGGTPYRINWERIVDSLPAEPTRKSA